MLVMMELQVAKIRKYVFLDYLILKPKLPMIQGYQKFGKQNGLKKDDMKKKKIVLISILRKLVKVRQLQIILQKKFLTGLKNMELMDLDVIQQNMLSRISGKNLKWNAQKL